MTKKTISMGSLAMINIAAICSIRNLPLTAEYGLAALFFFALASCIFFVPVSFVCAELSTGWPDRGVYRWVEKAMGEKMGFLAIWLQWISNIVWYPTILSFIAATFAYTFNPALATNKAYIFSVVFISFWVMTFTNFLGMKTSGWISTITALFGTILPGALIIALGAFWFFYDHPLQISFAINNLVPNLSSAGELAILAGVLLSFGGMEMSAVHAKEVNDPKRNYPKAIFISAIVILAVYVMGSLSISVVVPKDEIELASGAIEAFRKFFEALNISWAVPVIAAIMALGGIGAVSTWIVGPSKGIYASALDGELPKFFQKTNRRQMPINLMIFQAIIVSILSFVFLFMPNVSSSYWILIDLAAELYLIMYILLFISGILLKYKYPNVKRTYTVPFKNVGMWIFSLIGILGCLFTMTMGLFPPSTLESGKLSIFLSFLLGGMGIFLIIPFLVLMLRKPSWKSNNQGS